MAILDKFKKLTTTKNFMKIFVTGATGFIGKELVKDLAKKHKIKALVRSKEKAKELPKNVELVFGDISNFELLKKATKGVDVVFHLAGVIHPVNVDDSFYYDINVDGTENAAKASSENKVKHFVYCSSVASYGIVEDENQFIKEDCPCYGQNIYGKTKYEGELVTKKYCKVPYTILRPAKVLGDGDLSVLPVFKLVKFGMFPNLGGGKSTMMPVFVEDVVEALKKSMLNKKTYGKAYNIAGEDVLTKRKFMEMIADELKVKLLLLYTPIKPTLFVASIIEFVFKLINKEPPVSKKKLKFFLNSKKYSIAAAKKDIGWSPKKNLSKGIKEMISWYKNNNYL